MADGGASTMILLVTSLLISGAASVVLLESWGEVAEASGTNVKGNVADAETDEVLGVHMIGPRAADMIAEAVVAMEYRASAEDIARICHAHPTYAEAIKEAALAATANRAIHA